MLEFIGYGGDNFNPTADNLFSLLSFVIGFFFVLGKKTTFYVVTKVGCESNVGKSVASGKL